MRRLKNAAKFLNLRANISRKVIHKWQTFSLSLQEVFLLHKNLEMTVVRRVTKDRMWLYSRLAIRNRGLKARDSFGVTKTKSAVRLQNTISHIPFQAIKLLLFLSCHFVQLRFWILLTNAVKQDYYLLVNKN